MLNVNLYGKELDMSKKLLFIIPVLIIAAAVGALIGYAQIKKMPTSSLKNIRDAINGHNIEEFNQLVDVDTILNFAADDILAEKMSNDKLAYSVQQVADVYNNEVKPDFINVTKSAVEEYVSTGKVTIPKTAATEAQRWLKHSAINSCVIENMSKPEITGDSATAVVYFRNNELKFSFEIELELEKIGKNKWRIVGAKGFNDYNKALTRALDKKLNSLNAPIRDQLDSIFNIKELNAKIGEGDEYGFSQTLQIAMKVDVKSDKPLSKIIGRILIEDDNSEDNETSTPFEIDMAYHPQGLQTFNIDKTLNPFVRGDVNIMRHGMRRSQIRAEIDEIIFLDGSNIKVMDRLPD